VLIYFAEIEQAVWAMNLPGNDGDREGVGFDGNGERGKE
jgi:hypothetical protein